ncbi:MAG TPA: aminopeptidase [bacterium]|nr:aminopeptidase [bacterium]
MARKKSVTQKKATDAKQLAEKLCHKKRSGWNGLSVAEEREIMEFADDYKRFLDDSKTEREAVVTIGRIARRSGYRPIGEATKKDDRLFIDFHGVSCVLARIADPKKFAEGFLMVGAHIDTPRLDLKGAPLYEAEDMAYLKTHYYGGIKKYQWVTRPLAMHGVVILESGKKIGVVIGEEEGDPVFTINDLLPHLAQEQMEKNARKVIEGENLNILVGSIPYQFKPESNAVKVNILKMLHDRYGFAEQDLVSAELQLVPAGNARDVGLDRSFVGSHGQDDRICAFAGMRALLDLPKSDKNIVAVFFDKEEIGSKGNAGANSNLLELAVAEILGHYGVTDYATVLKALRNSKFLSADVNAGIDPEWAGVVEKMNAAKIGYGVCLTKFTGSGGKSNSSEAHAEFVAQVRKAFNRDGALWQTAELGKVDLGGGGTIAMYIAEYGMDVLDVGTALLSMHSPFEVASKADLYHTYKAYKAFYKYC